MGTEFFRGVITYGARGPSNIRLTAVQTVFLKAPQEVTSGWETLHWAKQSCRQILETPLVSVENPLRGKDYFHLLLHQIITSFFGVLMRKWWLFLESLALWSSGTASYLLLRPPKDPWDWTHAQILSWCPLTSGHCDGSVQHHNTHPSHLHLSCTECEHTLIKHSKQIFSAEIFFFSQQCQ